jgi:hypothetical protein
LAKVLTIVTVAMRAQTAVIKRQCESLDTNRSQLNAPTDSANPVRVWKPAAVCKTIPSTEHTAQKLCLKEASSEGTTLLLTVHELNESGSNPVNT